MKKRIARSKTRRNKGGALESNQQRREREQRERREQPRGRPRERQRPGPRIPDYHPVNVRHIQPQLRNNVA